MNYERPEFIGCVHFVLRNLTREAGMDQQLQTPTSGENLTGRAVPAARPLSDFCMERIGDEVVLFDASAQSLSHTELCGLSRFGDSAMATRSIRRINRRRRLDLVEETVSLAVEQLGESGLLKLRKPTFESTMHRRKMMKLAAAGVIGAVGFQLWPRSLAGPRSICVTSICAGCSKSAVCCGHAMLTVAAATLAVVVWNCCSGDCAG